MDDYLNQGIHPTLYDQTQTLSPVSNDVDPISQLSRPLPHAQSMPPRPKSILTINSNETHIEPSMKT